MSNITKQLYLPISATLFALTTLLQTNKSTCALIFALIAFVANFTSHLYGNKKTMQTIIVCTALSLMLLWKNNFYIQNIKIDFILIGSFLSVIVSIYCSINLFVKLKSIYNFHISNFISIITAGIIDCILMSLVLSNKLPIDKILSIFTKDIIFKFSYSFAISLTLIIAVCIAELLQKSKILS